MAPGRRIWISILSSAAALVFVLVVDQVAGAAGWAPENYLGSSANLGMWVTSTFVVVFFATFVGLILGLATRGDVPDVDASAVSIGFIRSQLWRRAFVVAFAGGGAVGALTSGLVSVTTNIPGDDSPSTLGATGGLIYGATAGALLGTVGGLVIAVAGSHLLSPYRGRALTLSFGVVASSIVVGLFVWIGFPVFDRSGFPPDEQLPTSIPITAAVASLIGGIASSPYLILWYIRINQGGVASG